MEDFDLESYNFALPKERIAQFPPERRGSSRLLKLDRFGQAKPEHYDFDSFLELLPPNALLVANNSRVISARLLGHRQSGGKVEFLLLTPSPLLERQHARPALAEGLLRPAARVRIGEHLTFGSIELEVKAKGEFGHCQCLLDWQGDLESALRNCGLLPLPPYIRRNPETADASRYQTVYASSPGSLAAPTAGLHFTPEMIAKLRKTGHEWTELTLHVGYGTFSPVRSRDIRSHEMHAEFVEIGVEAAGRIAAAKKEGRAVVAIGTTSCRALEGAAFANGHIEPYEGMINIFIYPGHKFKIVDGLLTNFHLPRSSLLMLVSAFAGRERVLAAYREAIDCGYRFFSYGDAVLII